MGYMAGVDEKLVQIEKRKADRLLAEQKSTKRSRDEIDEICMLILN